VGFLLLAFAATPALAQDAVSARIAASEAAAQRLQGPLDGTWALSDRRGRVLYRLEIGDPVTGGALQCAWSRPAGELGVAECERHGRQLGLSFDGARARLRRISAGQWRGVLSGAGQSRAVTLRRD
jgi:hypothetical protein